MYVYTRAHVVVRVCVRVCVHARVRLSVIIWAQSPPSGSPSDPLVIFAFGTLPGALPVSTHGSHIPGFANFLSLAAFDELDRSGSGVRWFRRSVEEQSPHNDNAWHMAREPAWYSR